MNLKIKGSKKKILDFIFLLLISLSIVSFFGLNYLNGDNCNYAVEEIHQYNNNIFKGNINTMEASFSARYYANVFMAFLIKVFNSNWFEVAFRLIIVNYILYALVITFLTIKLLKRHRLIAGMLLTLCLMTSPLISISFGLNFAPDVFLGTAAPLTFLSLICVLGEKKKWEIAWILAIISTFLHVHEGFWCAFLLGVIWVAISFSDKKINVKILIYICIYLFFLALIVLPPILNSSPVDDNYFTQIYVYIRTPHHLLLSSIGKGKILKATVLLLFISSVLFIEFFKYKKYKNEKRTIFIIIFISLAYLLLYILHYFSTEVYKIPFIITMYIPKSFRFFTFLGLINYIILGVKKIDKKKFLAGVILILIPMIPNLSTDKYNYYLVIVFFILFFILEKFNLSYLNIQSKNKAKIVTIIVYLFIIFMMYKNYNYIFKRLILIHSGILIYEFIFKCIKVKRKGIFLIFTLLLFGRTFYKSMNGKIFYISKNGNQYISGLEYAKKATDLELYELAIKFKNITKLDDEFLADPNSLYSNYFQLFSERNCYVLYKNVPSQKKFVIEWYERFLKAKNMLKADAEELKELLKDINVKYVLLSEDKFNILKDSPYFDEVIKNNKYGIFKLKEDIE